MKTYIPPEGLDHEEALLWLRASCEAFPCFLELEGKLIVVNDQQEFDLFIYSTAKTQQR